MELKVWVEGIQRVICGVNQNTTSQDVIVALAQATGKTGRFTLIEQWRDSEHLLTPSDNPLRVLQKYGEYANDVHFILRQSDSGQKARFTHNFTPPPPAGGIVKRNLTFSGAHNSPTNVFPPQHKQKPKTPSHAIIEESDDGYPNENHGRPPKPKQPPPYYMVERMLQDNIQKGRVIQENGRSSHNTYNAGGEKEHRQNRKSPHVGNLVHGQADGNGEWYSTHGNVETHEFVVRQPEVRRGMNNDSYNSLERKSRRRMEASTGDGNYNSLERKNRHKGPTQYSSPYSNSDQSGERRAPISMGSDAYDISVTPETKKTNRDTPEKESPMWSRRSPDGRSPPGSRSPVKSWKEIHETEADVEEFDLDRSLFEENGDDRLKRFHEKVMTPKISREQLLRLINLQQQKLETQDSQMSATTTDLTSMENRERDFTEKMETIHAEAHDLEVSDQQLTEEIKENDAVRWEDEIEVQKQLEKTLRTELTLVAAKLVNCESELVQCKNETRALTEEIEQEKQEQELLLQQAKEEHARMLEKVEHLKKKLEAAEKLGDADKKMLEEIESEIKQLETQLEEKSNEVTQIENDIKQANLLQFTGKVKPEKQDKDDKSSRSNSPAAGKVGSIRKMMGSPQLLGETVPTARNPQGLWV